ncbi:MAG: hypothetical protein NUV59_00145 [Patescibacteria group bacterium]|nr:hypothetical protein [Patescibacteria group bacterium]
MAEFTFQQSLAQAGLTEDQAAVYESLVKKGPSHARTVAQEAGISRTLAYKVLDELIDKELAEKKDAPRMVSVFSAAHPMKLKDVVEKRFSEAEAAKGAVGSVLSALTSEYNLAAGKPGVRFFEGKDGIRECINDSLTSKTDILSYVDIAAVERTIPDISRDFAKARRKLCLKKKNIGVDTPENRAEVEGYYPDVTEERLIPWKTQAFGTVMQIYDGKISYFTLEEPMMGVIVADPHIYEMHRSLFESAWNDPRAYIPEKPQAALRSDSSDDGSSTMS